MGIQMECTEGKADWLVASPEVEADPAEHHQRGFFKVNVKGGTGCRAHRATAPLGHATP